MNSPAIDRLLSIALERWFKSREELHVGGEFKLIIEPYHPEQAYHESYSNPSHIQLRATLIQENTDQNGTIIFIPRTIALDLPIECCHHTRLIGDFTKCKECK